MFIFPRPPRNRFELLRVDENSRADQPYFLEFPIFFRIFPTWKTSFPLLIRSSCYPLPYYFAPTNRKDGCAVLAQLALPLDA